MTSWAPELEGAKGPRYKAIAAALRRDVESGRLAPGTRLPTHRELADVVGCTVGTITRAYAEAAEAGLLEATVGRGTFVRERRRLPHRMIELEPPDVVDLAVNRPAVGPQSEALARTLAAIAQAPDLATLTDYAPSVGLPRHREAGARFLADLGLPVSPDQVVVACGAQSALAAVVAAVTEPGDRMVTECLGYPGIQAVAQHCRLPVLGVAIDDGGIIPEAFEQICREERPRLLACVPTHHNPTTATMPLERRRAIAEIARTYDVTILEDDVYGFLIDERPPPIATFAPERSCYVACTSKPLVPGLRIGYVAAPPALMPKIATAMRTVVWMAPPLMAEVATRWIEDGTARALMDWQKAEARARQRIAERVLGRFEPLRHPSGFHLWLPLPAPLRVGTFTAAARERGIAIAPGDSFVVGRGAAPVAVRLCVTAPHDADELERALGVIAEMLDRPPEASLTTF